MKAPLRIITFVLLLGVLLPCSLFAQTTVKTTGTGSTNYHPRYTNDSTITKGAFYESGGFIGLGTTSPANKFDLRGGVMYINKNQDTSHWTTSILLPINSSNTVPTDSAPNREMRLLQWKNGGAFGGGISWGMAPTIDTSANNTNSYWRSGAWSQGQYLLNYDGTALNLQGSNQNPSGTPTLFKPTSFMTFKNTGLIGINNTSPSYRLDVTSPVSDYGMRLQSGVDTLGTAIGLARSTGTGMTGVFGLSGTAGQWSAIASPGDVVMRNKWWSLIFSASDDIKFTTTDLDTERVTIKMDGRVGIGTNAPTELLSVNGARYGAAGSAGLGTFYNVPAFPAIRGSIRHGGNASGYNSEGGLQIVAQGASNSTLGSGNIKFFTPTANSANNSTDASLAVRMTIKQDGTVGIGTTSPGTKLEVVNANGSAIRALSGAYGSYTSIALGRTNNDGMFGVASGGGIYSNFATVGDVILRSDSTDLILSARNPTGAIRFGTGQADVEQMTLTSGGNFGIGTTNPDTFKLAVKGTIKAKELVIDTSGWADYVFADGYNLPTLESVEQSIKEEKHLPGIPSAAEVGAEGVHVAEMQTKLLKKIEELTLYMIEQNKTIDRLVKDNETLKQKVGVIGHK